MILISSSTLLLITPLNTQAQTNFDVRTEILHELENDIVNTTIYYTITTKDTPRVITYYTTTLPQENIKPDVYYINENIKIEPTYHKRTGATDIVIDLNNAVVSKDKPLTLRMTYSTNISQDSLSLLSGIKDSRTSKITLTYPKELGEISWSSTPVSKINQKGNKLEAIIENPQSENTSIIFGNNILYHFEISKNIINSTKEMYTSEIILPPNTNHQRVYIEEFQPTPNSSYKDQNGNYVLQYEVAPESSLPLRINGYIMMKDSITYDIDQELLLTEAEDYWKFTDNTQTQRFERFLKDNGLEVFENISELDSSQKDLFYKLTYNYVIKNLQPNALTLGSLTGGVRLGADKTFNSDSQVTAEDYSDTMVGLLRKYGVPARLVIGYVSDISDYNPDGMYHYWVEYFDNEKETWIVIDPFLEDFSQISLWGRTLVDHVPIIYRNSNSNTPKLPYFTENDFILNSSNEDFKPTGNIEVSMDFLPYSLSDSHLQGYIEVKNIGNGIIDRFDISKSNPDIAKYIDIIQNNKNIILLPNQTTKIYFNIPSREIESVVYAVISANSSNELTEEKYIEKSLNLMITDRRLAILSTLISILTYIIIAVPIYLMLKRIGKKNG